MENFIGLQPKDGQTHPEHLGPRLVGPGVVAGHEPIEPEAVTSDRLFDVRPVDIGEYADWKTTFPKEVKEWRGIREERRSSPVIELRLNDRFRISGRAKLTDRRCQSRETGLSLRDEGIAV